ncbi:S24 family peptidase [Photobacterium damselae]|uniref:S24 family peptidase n=1 Tax=Photobacterium damselae TaxID=38293 RepID=UPI003D7D5A5E
MAYNELAVDSEKDKHDPFLDNKKGSIQERLSMLAKRGTTREIAKKWNISTATLDRYINQGSIPSLERALTIAITENVDLYWLASGTSKEQSINTKETISIPKYNVSASAGGGCVIDNEHIIESIEVSSSWLKHKGLSGKSLCLIDAAGNSMEPTISNGADLLVELKTFSADTALQGIYVINVDGDLKVKRLEYSVLKDGYRIISDNPLYSEDFIKRTELNRLKVIGEVVMTISKPASQPASQPASEA